MTLEVTCGACQGLLIVETPGVVVACPHCGDHITAPDFPTDAAPDAEESPAGDPDPPQDSAVNVADQTPTTGDHPPERVADTTPPTSESATEVDRRPGDNRPVTSRRSAHNTVSRTLFLVLLSYASAITIACIYLFLQLQNAPLNNLERLPDPVETAAAGRGLTLVALDSVMPAGHTLALKQQQRFGNILVTPLRISRGTLDFEAFQDLGGGAKRESIGPVLKLWISFVNVSDDQNIAPLDRTLMLSRRFDRGQGLANNFLRVDAEDQVTLLQDNPIDGNWNWKGQLSDGVGSRVLKPGESFETYLPTEPDGVASLDGPLTWRVHIRKGYSKSGRGVTTVFEVAFDDSQIEDESPGR